MACKRSGVRIPIAPPRGLHVSPVSMFTFGADILAWLLRGWMGSRLSRTGGMGHRPGARGGPGRRGAGPRVAGAWGGVGWVVARGRGVAGGLRGAGGRGWAAGGSGAAGARAG